MAIFRFFRAVYRDNRQRREQRRHLAGDLILYVRNTALRPVEAVVSRRWNRPDLPVVFIVGPPRSGSTLLYQLLTRHLAVGYPNNFVARYWMAPLVGCMRHRARRNERGASEKLTSNLGATFDQDGPHEFSWFWHHWLRLEDSDQLTPSQLDEVDWKGLRRELGALAGWFDAPLVMKNINAVDFNIVRMARELPSSRFIHIQRSSPYVVQSILEARRRRYGSETVWWSVRPPDVEAWSSRDPIDQVCHQVRTVGLAIENALATLPESRRFELTYEKLVTEPASVLSGIRSWMGGVETRRWDELGRLTLDNRNQTRLDPDRFRRIQERLAAA